ncbi:MAG TPA: hypothetical protein VFS27_03680 [Blastocatellia bacterium]|jgi:hypothetical protein|nr:hypothetical protein [Blastocatellia bacterium]
MKRKVSEFSYGFVLTHELVNAYGYFPTDTPPASRNGRKKGAEDGACDAARGFPLFLQFKASEYMKRRNAGESKLVGLPYFRFALHRKTQSNQHELLIELEKKGYAVFYATPKIHEAVNLNSAFFEHQVVASSLFVNPGDIGELPDNRSHRVVFGGRSDDVYVCPKPQRLGGVIHGATFVESVRQVVSEKEPQSLDDEFFNHLAGDMVSLISPNRRIFDELSGGKVEMNASTFANYLAKTLFDCELLIVPS